jgi:hypothetical protein
LRLLERYDSQEERGEVDMINNTIEAINPGKLAIVVKK